MVFRVLFSRAPIESPAPIPQPHPDQMCAQHPQAPAQSICISCGAPICAICDFLTSDGQHVCPGCVTKSAPPIVEKGTSKMLGWSYVMAIIGSVGFGLLFLVAYSNMPKLETEALSMLVGLITYLPTLAGCGLAVGAMGRNPGQFASAWIALAWNAGILIIAFMLTMAGALMEGGAK
jgi:hypothetical protein